MKLQLQMFAQDMVDETTAIYVQDRVDETTATNVCAGWVDETAATNVCTGQG